ncbi:MAG: DUF459 domain-containing protein [Nannocystaceae bacterium]
MRSDPSKLCTLAGSMAPGLLLLAALVVGGGGCTPDKKGAAAESSSSTKPPAAAILAPADEEADATAATGEPAGEPIAQANPGDLPSVAPETETPEAQPETPPADAPKGPTRVLILGDSLAATGFGAVLEKRLDEHPDIECFRKAKSASGLARPDFFDWMGEAQKQVKDRDPHLVVVIMGGNDGQDLTNKTGKGKRVHWNSDEWNEAYRERIASFLDGVRGEGRKVLWLGLPKMGMQSFEKKLELIRDVQQNALADFDEATYLDTIPYFVDDKGNLQDKADVGKRKNQTLRADDGIHFTMAGSEYFAERVYPEVLKVIGLEVESK